MSMIPYAFDQLLTSTLGSRLVWVQAHKCPCTGDDGHSLDDCVICLGFGRYFESPSAEFRAGLVGLTGQDTDGAPTKLGGGLTGDATVSIPSTAPPYLEASTGDRFVALDALDTIEWVLTPGSRVRMPYGYIPKWAKARNPAGTALVDVTFPTPDANGIVTVSVRPITICFTAPRRYEAVSGIPQTRGWQAGLPKKMTLKLLDHTVRS